MKAEKLVIGLTANSRMAEATYIIERVVDLFGEFTEIGHLGVGTLIEKVCEDIQLLFGQLLRFGDLGYDRDHGRGNVLHFESLGG